MTDRFPTADERWPRNGEVADMKKPNLKWYDWNKLITAEDREMVCKDVDQLIKDGKYFTNSPKYQTNINVMGMNSPQWMKLKMSFIMSCFMYAGKELKIKKQDSIAKFLKKTIEINYPKIKSIDLKFDIPVLKKYMESKTSAILERTFRK